MMEKYNESCEVEEASCTLVKIDTTGQAKHEEMRHGKLHDAWLH